MAAQDTLAISRSIYDIFNRHDFNALMPLLSERPEWLDVPMNQSLRDVNGVKLFMQNWWTGFPDAKVEIKNMISSGDFVITEFIGRGTHQGVFMAMGRKIPATSKRIELKFCEVSQIKDGKLVSSHIYYDVFSLIRQLGLESQLGQLAAA